MKDLTPRIALILVFTVSHCLAQNVGNPFLNNRDCEAVDLVFVLDCSWSLRSPANFEKELNFVSDVVSVLDFSRSRVSVVTFSDDAKISIYFDQYNSLPQFQSAVKALPWVGGNTYTDQALEMMVGEVRTNQRNRANSGVTTMGVVITDGGSTDPYKTEDVVRQIHADGIEMFSIGVGTDINQKELEMIATDPDREHMFLLDDLNSLSTIKDMLASRFCRGSTPRPTQSPPENICRGKPVDLNFVLDSSWSLMNEENFQKELKFVTEVVNSLSVNLGTSRFSVITFSDDAVNQIPYAMFRDRRNFQASVLKLPWIGGNTYTDKALEIMLNQVTSNADSREDRLVVGVVVTDGGSTNPYRTENVVRKIHRLGITMFAIGVGMSINNKELEMIASKPTKDHLFMVDDLNGLNMLQNLLATRICPDRTRPLPPSPICQSSPADVFFIIDKSSSLMNQENFNKELAFVARVIDSIVVGTGPRDSRVGVISFSTDARLEFGLNAFTSNKEVEDALLYVEFSTGNTYTHKAINIMLEQFRTTARPNVRKIGVIVTDGQSTDPFNLRKSVDEMKRENIDIFAIGAGNFKIDELNLMASDPKTKHVFKVDELDDLSEIQVELNLKTCKGNQP